MLDERLARDDHGMEAETEISISIAVLQGKIYLRSPCKVRCYFHVVVHVNGGGAVMAIVGTNCGKALESPICQVFVPDTYAALVKLV